MNCLRRYKSACLRKHLLILLTIKLSTFFIELLSIFRHLRPSIGSLIVRTFPPRGLPLFDSVPTLYTPFSSTMASTVVVTHECPSPGNIYCSCNSSIAPLPLASPASSRNISNLLSPHDDQPHSGMIPAHNLFPTTLTLPNPDPAFSPTPPPTEADFSDDISTPRPLLRHLSESHHPQLCPLPATVVPRGVLAPQLPRKKSGEPLKPSLKVKTHSRGSLTVITDPSKSAPATPSHKGVHFHSQLEDVRLFLTRQKPLAVSRDGTPTDTSGTDSEFLPIIYPRDDGLRDLPLVMHCIDGPITLSPAEDTRDVAIESIDLSRTTVEGIVRVRNLAFKKWIAVHFTLDNWETASEVTAHYKDSLQNGTFDRFMFSINLEDVLSRAEEKTLYLAVRYSVAGREIWDNNTGRNYQVRIMREKALKANIEAVTEGCDESSRADDITDLRHNLEQAVELGCPSETIGGILAQELRRRWETIYPTSSPLPRDRPPSFKSDKSLEARYDFAASSRTPWRPLAAHQTPSHARTETNPSTPRNSVPPPDHDPDGDRNPDNEYMTVPSPRRRRKSGARNHARGGSINILDAPYMKRTPPTSLFGSPVPPSFVVAVCQRLDVSTSPDHPDHWKLVILLQFKPEFEPGRTGVTYVVYASRARYG